MKHFSDEQLETSAQQARARELSSLQEMLKHLREIDRRKLFSKRGFPSIYEYGMAEFKYSYDEIHRRVCAMKLLRDMPEIESKIADGSLQLTHLTQAQSFFRKVEHTKDEKLEILSKLENSSKAETKRILYNEEVKARYSFEADKPFEEIVERLKGLHPRLSFDQVMRKVCDIAIEKLDPMLNAERMKIRYQSRNAANQKSRAGAKVVGSDLGNRAGATERSRYIAAATKREVWLKAEGKCQNCRSTFGLEYDHVLPFAKGGVSEVENLRLLCRNCNQRHAIDQYKLTKMSTYLREPRGRYFA